MLDELHPDSALRRATLEVEQHVGDAGWDQAPRLFALVPTADLLAREPALADQLGDPGDFTAIEQEGLPAASSFEEALESLHWPETVAGCVAVVERIMLPPDAEDELPDDPAAALEFAANHPERREVRLVAGVLRDGQAHSAVRGRTLETELLEGPDLVPGLVARLNQTLLS